MTIIHLSDLDFAIPDFALEPERMWTKFSELTFGKDIDFKDHERFSRMYYLRSDDETEYEKISFILNYYLFWKSMRICILSRTAINCWCTPNMMCLNQLKSIELILRINGLVEAIRSKTSIYFKNLTVWLSDEESNWLITWLPNLTNNRKMQSRALQYAEVLLFKHYYFLSRQSADSQIAISY